MALKPCKGCGKEVDTTAKACPGCGKPRPTGSSLVRKILIAWLVMGAMGTLLVIVIVSVAITKRKAADTVVVETASAFGQPSSPPAEESPFVISVAMLGPDSLFECIDMEASGPANRAAMADKAWTSFFNSPSKRGTTPTRLSSPCAVQFSDRRPFAVCALPIKKPGGEPTDAGATSVTMRISNYSFATVFKSDALMKECLTGGGRWESMSRESDEFREAELRFSLDDLEAKSKKAQKDFAKAASLLSQ